MAENYEVGKNYYLPVKVYEVMGDTYTYPVRMGFENGNGCMDGKNAIKNEPNLLLTAYEISAKFRRAKDDERIAELAKQNNDLEKQNNDLAIQVTALMAEREQLKSSLEEAQRDIDERNVAVEHLDTAKEAIALLQQENGGLKSKLEDAEVMCGNAVDTSRKRQQKIATMEEVINALVEKIHRLEGGD